jgi:hypothetical protein
VGIDRDDQRARIRAYGRMLGWACRGGELHP